MDINELNFNPTYSQIVTDQFNSITPENIFKPQYLQPEPGKFSWADADSLVNYCLNNNKRLHGHTLIWHQQLPYWMNGFNGTREKWDSLMKHHIQTVVGHFKGNVTSWDVVNEAFEDNGEWRENIWLQHIGEDYIEKAFQYAHEADPSAKLFYNDYSLSSKSKKRNAALDLLNRLREKGIQIDGIGLQMHISHNYPSNNSIANAANEIWENGYLVHFSELDISINQQGKNMSSAPASRLAKQAEKYAFVFETFQAIPAEYQFGISMWGVSDNHSWIRGFFGRDDYPLLFDDGYEAKPAYCRLLGI